MGAGYSIRAAADAAEIFLYEDIGECDGGSEGQRGKKRFVHGSLPVDA